MVVININNFLSGTHYILPGPMEVFCNFNTKKTCIQVHSINKNVTYKEAKPFWLSQKNVSLKDIYGVSMYRKQSKSVIKYQYITKGLSHQALLGSCFFFFTKRLG